MAAARYEDEDAQILNEVSKMLDEDEQARKIKKLGRKMGRR